MYDLLIVRLRQASNYTSLTNSDPHVKKTRLQAVRVVAPLQAPACPEEDDLHQSHVPAPHTCHPGMVGPLTSLGVVVTLAETLVECVVSGEYRCID